ncbi:MAG: arsenite efflux transporter metallochaperone ArsD [Actinobacteria bacterium]|nr:MAG: arsenite efflux transporter metallochaperone ArsD [Actinomycetota bacterium]
MSDTTVDQVRETVRARYASAAQTASCCSAPSDDSAVFGSSQYDDSAKSLLPEEAIVASLGCGNPTALAELQPGETVLDLGSGGGIDVLLSAQRVGPTGMAYGLDMTDEMLSLARQNQAKSGLTNVEFRKGHIEDIPLPDNSVDVIISNCVINLSGDKNRVFAEAFRVLRPGGRLAVSDVVLSRPLPDELAAITALWTGCISGALTEADCMAGLTAAGFEDVTVDPTQVFDRAALEGLVNDLPAEDVPAGIDAHAAITSLDGVIRSAAIRAVKPGGGRQPAPPVIRVFEPALCCNTGVCGPDLDQALVEFTADLAALQSRGADIQRHNLANDPMAFAADPTVKAFLQVAGSAGLPLTTVDGVTVLTGRYPSRGDLERYAGVGAATDLPTLTVLGDDEGGACCGSGGCC